MDDYGEANGGPDDTIVSPAVRLATRDTFTAVRKAFAGVDREYLKAIIVQRCELDAAAVGRAIPMSNPAVKPESHQIA